MNIVMKVILFNLHVCVYQCFGQNNGTKWPTIGISVLVRNKAHTLPYFLSGLFNLDYPKDRIYIWITSDYNEDNSIQIVEDWAKRHKTKYNNMFVTRNNLTGPLHKGETTSSQWTRSHFKHVIRLREEAMNFARKMWADFIFMIDADAFLVDSSLLKHLVEKDLPVAAPLLLSDGLYSNYWCGMTDKYYYQRTDDYKSILYRENVGCFEVPMVHTAVLISLKRTTSDLLTYDPKKLKNYTGPEDDIITFAVNAKLEGIPLYICNENVNGFLTLPLQEDDDLQKDFEQLLNVKLEAIHRGTPLPLNWDLKEYVTYPKPDKYGCNEVYMINLERRDLRRKLMEMSFKELGMDVNTVKAVDGKELDLNNLDKIGITLMTDYEDPYHKRPMKAGEIGCFLSHYNIWNDIVKNSHDVSLILEDDIHFVPYFRVKYETLRMEMTELDWDLMYIGRKILSGDEEELISPHITRPLYSYWTLGYLITKRGAQKLLDAKPLDKMLPVDEYLPIMFDEHPNGIWKSYFSVRNLRAFSSAPLLVHPTHYTGQPGYISDTEDSVVVDTPIPTNSKQEL